MGDNIMNIRTIDMVINDQQSIIDNMEGKASYYQVIAHVTNISQYTYYESCQNDNCKKKVTRNTSDGYDCEKCNKTYDKPKPRFFSTVTIADDTGSLKCMFSGEEFCKKLLGISCDELKEMKETDMDKYMELLNSSCFKEYRFKVYGRKDTYNGVTRVRY